MSSSPGTSAVAPQHLVVGLGLEHVPAAFERQCKGLAYRYASRPRRYDCGGELPGRTYCNGHGTTPHRRLWSQSEIEMKAF
jgi:hypothetical protein